MTTSLLHQTDIAFQAGLYTSTNPTRRWLHTVRRTWVMKALLRYAPPDAHFLEVGVGACIYTSMLSAIGTVTALDINESFLQTAAALPNTDVIHCDIRTFHQKDIADVALCSEVLEHIQGSTASLHNIFGALRPGGYLVLTTPNAYSTMEWFARLLVLPSAAKLARLIYNESVEDLGHINTMTRSELARQIRAAGFDVVERTDLALYIPVLAEFGGSIGMHLARILAAGMRHSTLLSHLLWTQCWVLRKPLRG